MTSDTSSNDSSEKGDPEPTGWSGADKSGKMRLVIYIRFIEMHSEAKLTALRVLGKVVGVEEISESARSKEIKIARRNNSYDI